MWKTLDSDGGAKTISYLSDDAVTRPSNCHRREQ